MVLAHAADQELEEEAVVGVTRPEEPEEVTVDQEVTAHLLRVEVYMVH
jgi:hypothetical protein